MNRDNRFYKVISIITSLLFTINSVSWGAPNILIPDKSPALRASSAGRDGHTAKDMATALKTQKRQVFPVKMVDKKVQGLDSSRAAGKETVIATATIELPANTTKTDLSDLLMRFKAVEKGEDSDRAREAVQLYMLGLSEIAKRHSSEDSIFHTIVTSYLLQNAEINLQLVKDNDKLTDIMPIAENTAKEGGNAIDKGTIRIDIDIVKQLGITFKENKPQCANKDILKGAILLCAMSFIDRVSHMRGDDQRQALHNVVDFYLGLSKEERNTVIAVLRTEKIDSGNTFNIFLQSITDSGLAEQIDDIDIKQYINTPSVELKDIAADLEAKGNKIKAGEKEKLENIEATLKWRDKQISWIMLFERIDPPVDYEQIADIVREGQRKQRSGEPFNVDEWYAQLHEAVTGSFRPEVEDANIFRIAKWANQNGIRLVSGRLGRAFENQARMVSVAKYVVITQQMQAAATGLRAAVSDIEPLVNPAQRLVLLLTQTTEPSYVELDVAIKAFTEAAIDYKAKEAKRIEDAKRGYRRRTTASEAGLKVFDESIKQLNDKLDSVLSALGTTRNLLEEAKKNDAAFVFLIQRFVPAETHKYAKAITFRDVDAGKEDDIRDLLRQGGHLAYCTPGQGKDLNILMFANDIIEAIPMLVKERVIRVQRPDGTYYDQTEAVVDQQAMQAFFRNVFAPNFLKGIRHAIDTQHIELARRILFSTEKYRRLAERYQNLPFAEFMETMALQAPEFSEEVAMAAALIDLSYKNLIDEITLYRNRTGSDRITAVKEMITGKNRNTSDANIMNIFLKNIEQGYDVTTAYSNLMKYYSANKKDTKWMGDIKKVQKRIAPYWDWKERNIPTLHDLTTQAPGLTEAYIQTWIEEEMALISILEDHPEISKEVKQRSEEYTKRVIACTDKVLKEYGMEAIVEEVWQKSGCRDRNAALLAVLTTYPFVADEVAKLAVLIEYSEAKGEVKNVAGTEDTREVKDYLARHGNDNDFIDEVIKGTVALNGLTLQNQIVDYQREQNVSDYRQAALAVINNDTGYKQDYENQKLFYARGCVINELATANPDMKLKDRVKSFIREHTALGVSTARKEIIAKHKLQQLILNSRCNLSAEGPKKAYNLLYTPSRVNLGDKELESVQVWSQVVGAKGQAAARAGYDFYRLINANPVVYLSPKIAEALKTAENGSMMSQLAFGNSVAMLLNFLEEGDAQRLLDEIMSRGDRKIPFPGEGYGGYCVPKDGLFLAFVVALSQENKLADMGIDPRFRQDILRLAKDVLIGRSGFASDFEWEMWAAEKVLQYDALRQYVDITKKGDSEEKILIFNITNLAKVIQDVGRPSYELSTGRGSRMLWNILAEWGLNATIVQAERINRMMPFIKAWMILRNNPNKVNLTAEYKSIAGSEKNVGDVRFATGIRVFEVLTGCCDHLIRQFDEEGQNIARIMRFGFNPESQDEGVKKASIWLMDKLNIAKNNKDAANKLKELFPYYDPPKDIVLTASSGVAVSDIMGYTSDRQVSMDDIATVVQQTILDLGLTDKQIAASADVYGADITQWPKLKDNPAVKEMLDKNIEVKGLDGKIYRYPLKSAIHYLALKQRTLARKYEMAIQGCDVVNLGVVSGELEKIARNTPKLITLMLSGQPLAEPKIIDGSPGKARDISRAFMDMDVKMFFAACENYGLPEGQFATPDKFGKRGAYECVGWGKNDIERLRQTMHRHRQRAQALLDAISSGILNDADALLAEIENEIASNNEATEAVKNEEMVQRWKKWQPRDKWLSCSLSNLAAGLPLSELDFGTWLALGGMYLLTGKSQNEIEKVRKAIEGAATMIKQSSAGQKSGLAFLQNESKECEKSLLLPQYQPEAAEFAQEKLVAISSKAIEAGATQARERRRALARRAAVARAKRLATESYKKAKKICDKNEKAGKIDANKLISNTKDVLMNIKMRTDTILKGRLRKEDVSVRLDTLNKACGVLSAYVNKIFMLLIDRYADNYADGDISKSREIRNQLKKDMEEAFGVNGFNPQAITKLLGGYESIGVIATVAQAAPKQELAMVTDAIEMLYSLYGITQTIDYLQVAKEDVDLRMFWDNVTLFFAETINDHFYQYIPWVYSTKRGTAYKDIPQNELYAMAAEHHKWLYEYMRSIMVNITNLSELSREEQDLLLGNYSDGIVPTDAIGVDYERSGLENALNEGEPFWRAYNQLREITFIMNDGLAASEILKTNPDLKKKGYELNSKYPLPVVFEEFDPALIDASNRVNMALLFPVGRTHQSKLLRSGASCNLARIAEGKKGLNVIITRDAPIKDVNGKKVVVLTSGHFYMNREEFKNALIACKGYSEKMADRAIADLEKQGSMVDGRIRVAAKFKTPVIATSVVPFHGLPVFDDGRLENAGIPATCQSLCAESITYEKADYHLWLEGTGVNLPSEIQWLTKWLTDQDIANRFANEEARISAVINGFEFGMPGKGKVTFKGLRAFADELIEKEEDPIIIAKGAEESGARNLKVFLLKDQKDLSKEDVLREAAIFILQVSRTPQNVVIQRVIRINPEFWASEKLMDEFTNRRILERGSAVLRTRIPTTPYYCSLRVVPSSPSPDKPYDMTSHIVVINTEIATNVGRGGSLEALLSEWVKTEYFDVIRKVLERDAAKVMEAMNRYSSKYAEYLKEKYAKKKCDNAYVQTFIDMYGDKGIGKDATGTSYGWMPFALLDFLAEPVFEKEGKIVDIKPKYDQYGKRIGSDIILEDDKGERFVGKIKPGEDGWRVYLIEPNSGIGQIDRRTLRKEELAVETAAQEGKSVDWAWVESDDLIILNNWADRGVEYGKALFGDDFFKPSSTPQPGKTIEEIKENPEVRPLQDPALGDALKRARAALDLSDRELFDAISLSVLLKYYLVEKLEKEGNVNVNEIRSKVITGEMTQEELERYLPEKLDSIDTSTDLSNLLSPLCGKYINMRPERIKQILGSDAYKQNIRKLIYAHFMTEWSCQEVEVAPSPISASNLISFMPDKKYFLGHLSVDNPAAPNETFALMADSDFVNSEIAVLGVERADFVNGNSTSVVLANIQLPKGNRKRLVRFALTEPILLDAIWRDETCPVVDTNLVQINPAGVSDLAHDKNATIAALSKAGVNVPDSVFCAKNRMPGETSAAIGKFLSSKTGLFKDTSIKQVELFVSPNKGTQGIGTRHFVVRRDSLEADSAQVADYAHQLSLVDDVIVRAKVGNVRFHSYVIDLRYNVIYKGGDNYTVDSEYAVVASDTGAPIASVGTGGRIINTLSAYQYLDVTLPGEGVEDLGLTDTILSDIRNEACKALAALNNGKAESDKLLFAGVDIKLEAGELDTHNVTIKPVVLEVNSQAAGLSHSYEPPITGREDIATPRATLELWGYLGQRIKDAGTKASPTGTMNATIEDMGAAVFDIESDPGWGIENLAKQKQFFVLLSNVLANKGPSFKNLIARHYVRWLINSVFPKMQRMAGVADYNNRLWPNELMEFISSELKTNTESRTVFENSVNQLLPELLFKIADTNADVYHRFLSDLADKKTLTRAIEALGHYIDQQRQKPPVEMVKAEIACAIMADIYRYYFGEETKAATYENMIKDIDKAMYLVYKEQLLANRPRRIPRLADRGENRVLFSQSPSRICWSSAVGTDAHYNVLLDPDGGFAVNAPVIFSPLEGQPKSVPLTLVQRIKEPEIILQAISNMVTTRAAKVIISAANIEELYCLKNGRVFADVKDMKDEDGKTIREADPLSFLKYALFFTGIIGSGIDSMPDSVISAQEKEAAKKNPIMLAQLYYDKCPQQALTDLTKFMHGGGIEITCDNHIGPASAGFSSSSNASVSILLGLYGISGQREFVDNMTQCTEMALIFENDLGRGTGPQDTTGVLGGIKDIRYHVENSSVVEDILTLDLSRHDIKDIEILSFVFAPGIARAASKGIGERQFAYLLHEPEKFKAIQTAKVQHHKIVEALENGQFDKLGSLMWEYTFNRNKIHKAIPDEMMAFFKSLQVELMADSQKEKLTKAFMPLISGGELAGSMGSGAAAILLATDYGLQKIRDAETGEIISKLEAEIRKIAQKNPIFANCSILHLGISDSGPNVHSRRIYPLIISEPDTKEVMDRKMAEDVIAAVKQILQPKRLRGGLDQVVIGFDAGPSQDGFLNAFVEGIKRAGASDHNDENYYAGKIVGFNISEYENIPEDSSVSSKAYLHEHLVDKFQQGVFKFHFLSDFRDGDSYTRKAADEGEIDIICCALKREARLGLIEPPADFVAEGITRTMLTQDYRKGLVKDYPQQFNPTGLDVNEAIKNTPLFAKTMTIRTMLVAKCIFVIGAGKEKQDAARALATSGVNPNIPATLLKTHPQVNVYLDNDAAALLESSDNTKTSPTGVKTVVEDGQKIYRLTNRDGNLIEVIPGVNATVRSMKVNGEEILYYPAGEMTSRGGIPGPVFFFANRIKAGKFEWNGKTYDLTKYLGKEIRVDSQGNALHGILTNEPWEVVTAAINEDNSAEIVLRYDAGKNKIFQELFGIDAKVDLTYKLQDNRLDIITKIINLEDPKAVQDKTKAFPFSTVVHPYFKTDGRQVEREIPAQRHWMARDCIPTGLESANGRHDLRQRAMVDGNYDDVYTNLTPDTANPGYAVSRIFKANGTIIEVSQNIEQYPHVVFWAPSHISSISIEPQSSANNAFNIPDMPAASFRTLGPGQTWEGKVSISVIPAKASPTGNTAELAAGNRNIVYSTKEDDYATGPMLVNAGELREVLTVLESNGDTDITRIREIITAISFEKIKGDSLEWINSGETFARRFTIESEKGDKFLLSPEKMLKGLEKIEPAKSLFDAKVALIVKESTAQKASIVSFEEKASPTGTAYVQIGPADIKLLSEVSTKAETISTSDWDYLRYLKKFSFIQPAGLVLANMPEEKDSKNRMEAIKAQTQDILYSEKLRDLNVKPGKILTDTREVVQDMGDGTEIEYVPISPTQAILMQQSQGTYVPIAADKIVNEAVKRTQADRRGMLIDFDALGYLHKRADGSIAFIPNDKAIRAISILNNINGLKTSDNKQRYYISVYSHTLSANQMKDYLGALAVPFADSFINTPTVAEAINTIIQEQKIAPENIAVTLAETTADNPNVLGKLADSLAKAVKFVMVKTPAPGANFASYKAMLITTLRLLEGTISQPEIERLRHDIEIAPGIRPLDIEPESDKKEVEAISNMQAAIKA